MMLLAEDSVTIRRSVDEVFDYACNLERFGEWFPGVLAIRSANTLAHGEPGKQYLESVSIPLRGPRQVLITVKEAERGRRIVTEGRLAPLWPRMEIDLSAAASGATRVEWRMYSRSRHALVRLLLVPLARGVMRRRARAGLERLRARLEAAA